MDKGPGVGGPGRWLAALTLSWLRSESPRTWLGSFGGLVSRCLKYLFSEGLTSR